MDQNLTPSASPLSQTLTRDGKSVTVDIDLCDGGWVLKITDEFGNSTQWEDVFSTDHEALAEAQDTIEQQGIDCLIGTATGYL